MPDRELDGGEGADRSATAQPTAELSATRAHARWVNAVREFLLVAVLYLAYTAARLLAADDRAPALLRAHRLLDFEAVFDLDWEHGIVRHVAAHPLVGLLSCFWYSTAHYVGTPIVLIWLYRRGRRVYLPARRALLVATALGLVMYLLLPTAPPRMMAGYPDILSIHSHAGWWGAEASAPRGTGNLTNELAAFPSLHAGWSLWVALALHRGARRWSLRIAGWTYAGLTAFVVVGTANHWVLDVLAGWSVVAVAWIATKRCGRGGGSPGRKTPSPSPSATDSQPPRSTEDPPGTPLTR
jgi:membrane-associated phospholipid phosphatase